MNKIIYLFKIIADSSIDNKIALMATLVSAGALIASIYFNHKTRKQYINSLNPLLSFELRKNMGSLCLMMINTGQSAAKNINISFKKIQNNGEYDTFDIDNNLKNKLDLYPGEIENELIEKKYGLVWEKYVEKVDEDIKNNVPVFKEIKDKSIKAGEDDTCNFLLEGDNLHSLKLLEKHTKIR